MKKTIFIMMTLVLIWGCTEIDELINESVKQNKSTYMGLYIKTYGGFTPQEIIDRASNIGNLSVAAPDVYATDITMTQIRNVLGESTNKLSELCLSPNVNKYSGYSPITWYIDAVAGSFGPLKNKVTTPYTMGSFAAYNHNASPYEVTYDSAKMGGTLLYGENDRTPIFYGVFKPSEFDFTNIRDNSDHVVQGIEGFFLEYTINNETSEEYITYDFSTSHGDYTFSFETPYLTFPNYYTLNIKFGLWAYGDGVPYKLTYLYPTSGIDIPVVPIGVLDYVTIEYDSGIITTGAYDQLEGTGDALISPGDLTLEYQINDEPIQTISYPNNPHQINYTPPSSGSAVFKVWFTQKSTNIVKDNSILFIDGIPQ